MVRRGDVSIRFWGVRGSIACPGPDTVRYGGNTACVEIRCDDRLLIMDGGTGLREFGIELLKNGPVDADLFYSHTHFDHICGLPFFSPCYSKGSKIRLWAGHLLPENQLENVLYGMMMAPLFPVPMALLHSQVSFTDFRCGETLKPQPGIVHEDRTAQPSEPRHRLPPRIWRQDRRLHHRYRAQARRARPEHPGAGR